MWRVRYVWVAFAALANTGCRPPAAVPAGCGRDVDCRAPRVCDAARCVEPPAPPMPDVAEVSEPSESELLEPGEAPESEVAPEPPVDAAAPVLSRWPVTMFRGDPRHRGRAAGAAPARTPVAQWGFVTAGPIFGAPAVAADGTVIVASHDRWVYALRPSGELRWRFETRDLLFSSPAIDAGESVIFGSDDDTLYFASLSTGAQRASVRLGRCRQDVGIGPEASRCDGDGGPTIGPDGTVYIGADGVYAFSDVGELRWHFELETHCASSPAVSTDGMVVFGCNDDRVYAVAADTGELRWQFDTMGDVESSPAIDDAGNIYVGSDDDRFYSLRPDGSLRFALVTDDDVRSSPAIGPDGTVYVGSFDGRMYAVSGEGELRWRYPTADRIRSSPVVSSDGAILFGSQDDRLYCLEPSGALRWALDLGADVDSTPTVTPDGVIYVGADDGMLRRLIPAESAAGRPLARRP